MAIIDDVFCTLLGCTEMFVVAYKTRLQLHARLPVNIWERVVLEQSNSSDSSEFLVARDYEYS